MAGGLGTAAPGTLGPCRGHRRGVGPRTKGPGPGTKGHAPELPCAEEIQMAAPPALGGQSAPFPPGNRRSLARIGGGSRQRAPIGCNRMAWGGGRRARVLYGVGKRPPFCVGDRGAAAGVGGAVWVVLCGGGGCRRVTAEEQRGLFLKARVCVSVLLGERDGQKSVREEAGREGPGSVAAMLCSLSCSIVGEVGTGVPGSPPGQAGRGTAGV